MGVLNQPFLQHRSKIGSKKPFGLILARFGRVLGGFWKASGCLGSQLGRVLGPRWVIFRCQKQVFWKIIFFLPTLLFFVDFLELAGAESLNGTPALIREASQCAGVPLPRGWTGLYYGPRMDV